LNNNTKETVPNLLVKNIPRELVMSIEEALDVGAGRAFVASVGMNDGHLPHVVGIARHFHMNESFHTALVANDASPSPIQGNGVVTGRSGIFTIARFNIPAGFWINGRRSKIRRQMSYANKAIEPLVQPELFNNYVDPSEATVFFVSCFSKSLHEHPTGPVSIDIAVPDREMRGWLFREPLSQFLRRYEQVQATQNDLAVPTLKKNIGKQQDKNGTTE